MGAQIAAMIAERGIECDLLDLTVDAVEDAKRRLLTMRPRALEDSTSLDGISAGSIEGDLGRLSDADWVLEAIVEREEPKLDLWSRVSSHVRPDAVLSTNTSGIPIRNLARALPGNLRRRFLGTHFFNPPKYLRLLEIIPTDVTDPDAVAAVRGFGQDVLDKGVVIAKDVPGFITNRIGCFYFLTAMRAADEIGLSPDEADAISGPLLGRSNSATYRTVDLVGVDVLLDICDNTREAVSEDEEKLAFEAPQYLREMRRRNWLGNKTGQGFYRRERVDGRSQILALDTEHFRYRERKGAMTESIRRFGEVTDTSKRLRMLVDSRDVVGRYAWHVLSRMMAFSANKVGEVAEDVASIDRAMRWGFNWELGPFETWEALGVVNTAGRMKREDLSIPDWVSSIAESGSSFYRHEGGALLQAAPHGGYDPVPRLRRPMSCEPCPLCNAGGAADIFRGGKASGYRDFLHCGNCDLVFVPRSQLLDAAAQKSRYLQHNNDPDDPDYRAFLRRMYDELRPHLHTGAKGLDFGAGPGPALQRIMLEDGFAAEAYDIFFHPDKSVLAQTYEFVTCTETAEHFTDPIGELECIDNLLIPGGWLGVMTGMLESWDAFSDWYYHRDPTHVNFFSRNTMLWIADRFCWAAHFPRDNVALFKKTV